MSCPSSRRSGASAAALLLLLAGPAGARAEQYEIVPRVTATQSWESNPLGRTNDETQPDDLITRVNPSLALTRRSETGNEKLAVSSRARFYRDLTDLNTFDPKVDFELKERLTSRIEAFSDATWSKSKATDPFDLNTFEVYNGRPDIERWDALGGLAYSLSPLSSARFSYGHYNNDYQQTDVSSRQRDRSVDALTFVYSRTLSQLDQIALVLNHQAQDFDPVEASVGFAGRDDQTITQQAATLSYTRTLDKHTSLTLTGGLRTLHSEGNGFSNVTICGPGTLCPPGTAPTNLPLDETSSGFTGGIQLTRTAKRGSLTLGFNQETRPQSGLDASVDVQTLSGKFNYRLSERSSLELRAAQSDQTSASDNYGLVSPTATPLGSVCVNSLPGFRFEPDSTVTVVCAQKFSSATDNRVRTLGLTLDWRSTKRFTTFLSYDYTDREASGVLGQTYDNHRIQVGFRYAYDIDVP